MSQNLKENSNFAIFDTSLNGLEKDSDSEKEIRAKNAYNPYIQEYLDYLLMMKGYSTHTLDSYKHDLVWLFRYLLIRQGKIDIDQLKKVRKNGSKYIDYTMININDIDLEDIQNIDYPDLIAFLTFTARELQNSENSRKRKVTTLKGFFRYLNLVRHYINSNPAEKLEAPKIGRSHPSYLTLEQAQDLLDAPMGKHRVRDRAILTIFLNTGLRVSELCALKTTDIQSEMLHINGKGNKDRNLFLNDACLQALALYLPIREKQIEQQELDDINTVFISQKGTQFSARGIEHMIEKYIKQIGLDPRRYTVHTLRHTAATLMHKYGQIDVKTLQQVLGHESTQTTEIYTHLDSNEIQEALNSNPLSRYHVERNADVSAVYNINRRAVNRK